MCMNDDLTTLVPPGFTLRDICGDDDRLDMVLRPARRSCRCPDCGASPESIHSR